MKKTLLSLAVFSLIFAYGGITLAQVQGQNQVNPGQQNGQEANQPNRPENRKPRNNLNATSTLEKIANPGQINLFERIQKIGASLFGIKKQQNNQGSDQQNGRQQNGQTQDQANVASSTGSTLEISPSVSSTLEKISSPAEISLFDKIKKIGAALFGVRKNNNNQKPNGGQPKPVYVTSAATQCVKDAIDKKDTALKASQTSHAQSVSSAIDTRGTCQKTALDQATAKAQADANKICVDAFQHGIQDINKTMEKTKKDAFETYKNDLKSCSALQASSIATSTTEVQTEQIMIPDEIAPAGQQAAQTTEQPDAQQ